MEWQRGDRLGHVMEAIAPLSSVGFRQLCQADFLLEGRGNDGLQKNSGISGSSLGELWRDCSVAVDSGVTCRRTGRGILGLHGDLFVCLFVCFPKQF